MLWLAACSGRQDACGDRYEEVDGVCVLRPEEISDADGDGLSDADEVRLGTDPDVPDTDGDGYRDGDEVAEGKDPLDPASVIYQGGWPYDADKDALGGPELAHAVAAEGEPFARLQIADQHGDIVDLYDFARHGPVLVAIVAMWSHGSQNLAQWATFTGPYGDVKNRIDAGEIRLIHVIAEDLEGQEPDVDDAALWADACDKPRVPVLAGDSHVLQTYMLSVPPSIYLLDEDLRIVAMPDPYDATGAYAALDAAAGAP